ncbi:uncharacterized protein LOC102654452 [Apis mellifera]|uniref:Odorant receptor n=1 Tax=Apis mellifera TaxID=7460 RepID=A0A7M7L4S7_APIME|nr:uncharacterized protein LOC102654452 [Apis mellifera]|eukprot:XP_026294942.1 uncharacterized protein LOC102654452 [Apis mellifera]
MKNRLTPEKAILFTKLSVALTCSWPPSPLATKAQHLFFNALWCIAFLTSVMLFLPLLAAIYVYRKHPVILGKTVSLTAAVAQVTIKMIICRLQQKRFQVSSLMLYSEMENFCKQATNEEKIILQRYVDRYKYFHSFYILWSFLTTIFVICGPLYTVQTFPTHAIYPFSVRRHLYKGLIFFHQSLVGFQVSSGMAIDTQIALLLRYATARFEILGIQFNNAKSDGEFDACIKKHDELLRNQPLILKALYAIVVFSASVELFMYAWPADSLMHMVIKLSRYNSFKLTIFNFIFYLKTMKMATKVYNMDWYGKDIRTQRKILFIILRSQKYESFGINGIVPALSLSYYGKVLCYSIFLFVIIVII